MKNIYLEITPFFPTVENFRGSYIYDQVKAIERNSDYDVIVLKLTSFYEKDSLQKYDYQGIKVYNFKVIDFPSSVLPGFFQAINLYRLKKFIKDVVQIDLHDVKIIHSHVIYPAGALAVGLGKEYGIKNFVQHHGLDVFQTDNGRILKGKLKEFNIRIMHRKYLDIVNTTDLNIGVSQKVIDQLKNIKGFSNSKVYVLYNGVDTDKFYRKKGIKKLVDFTIGCIGNFWPLKDQMTLLKALNSLIKEEKNLKIKFVGSGSTLYLCKDYVVQHHLENYVEFLSEIDHTMLNDFYNELNLFILPSYYEALGCVYTEALQVGIPLIGVKGQGIEELLKEEDKYDSLITKGDYRSLAKLIRIYIEEPKNVDYDLSIDHFIKSFLEFICLKENKQSNRLVKNNESKISAI